MYYNTFHPARTEEKLLFKNAIKTNHPAKLAKRKKSANMKVNGQRNRDIGHPAQADNVTKLRAKCTTNPAEKYPR